MRSWIRLIWLTGESILLLALWLCSLLGANACGATQVAKMAENHLGSYWFNDQYHLSVIMVSAGRAIGLCSCFSSYWSAVLISWSNSPWWKTDLKVHRHLFTFVQMCCAICTSFSKQIFNNIFIITEQENKAQYPCAFEVASSAAIIVCKSIFYILSNQTFSKMPIILMLLLLTPLVVFCFCSVFVDGVFSYKLYLDDLPMNFCWEKKTWTTD